MRETRFRVGDRVQFEWVLRSVQGIVKEDRGPIGIKGRRLYRVEFHPDSLGEELFQIELPAVDLQLVRDAVSSE